MRFRSRGGAVEQRFHIKMGLCLSIPEHGDIAATGDFHDHVLMQSLRVEISFDPLAQVAYVSAHDIVEAGVVAVLAPKDLGANLLFMNLVAAFPYGTLADIKEEFLKPSCASQLGAWSNALEQRPTCFILALFLNLRRWLYHRRFLNSAAAASNLRHLPLPSVPRATDQCSVFLTVTTA